MEYVIEFAVSAAEELKSVRVFDRRRIVEEIEKQLTHEPAKPSRNRKSLTNVTAGFEHLQPLWELRVGDFRVFYDVSEKDNAVVVRAVRQKAKGRQTEDIIE